MSTETRAACGSTGLDLGPRDEAWDASAAQKSLQPGDYMKAHLYRDMSKPADQIGSYKLPFAKRTDGGLRAVWKGITAAAGGHGVNALKGVSDADKAAIKTKITAYYHKAAKKYDDEEIESPFEADDEADMFEGAELRYAVMPITGIEVRDPQANDDGSWTMSGYAAVFNQETTLYNGRFIKLTESLDPGSFDRCLREQGLATPAGVVHFNPSHDMSRAVAATDVPMGAIGSLALRPDARGLFYLARVSRDDPDAVAMAAKMRTGVLRQASFAFTIGKAEYVDIENDDGPDESHRRILEVAHLYDVCATPQGAYPQTVSQLRSYAAALGQPIAMGGHPRQPDLGGETAVSPATGGGGGVTRRPPVEVYLGLTGRRHRKAS
jgi:HK97 family phage prohead protease